LAWRHKKLNLATLAVGGREYRIGLTGDITPDPHPDDVGFFSTFDDIVNLDEPDSPAPKAPKTPNPVNRPKRAKKKR